MLDLVKPVLIFIIIGGLVFLNINQCNQLKKVENYRGNNVEFLQDSVKYYKNKYGQEIANKTALKGDKKQLSILLSKQIDSTQALSKMVKEFKKVSGAGTIRINTEIDTFYVPFEVPVDCGFLRDAKIKEDYYSLTAEVNEGGLRVTNLTIPNNISFVVGRKRKNIFSKSVFEIDVNNSNPYITTEGVDSYIYEAKVNKWSIGPYIGYDPFNQQLSTGISLQYGLISF